MPVGEYILMTYFESAAETKISRARAIRELDSHGVTDIDAFYQDCGFRENYDAQDVLAWLGY